MIAFEGFSASGKGSCISKLIYSLDLRYAAVYSMGKETEDAASHPFFWNYWIKTPSKGHISIFDKSWYRTKSKTNDMLMDTQDKDRFEYDLNSFERQLTDSGTVIIKLFLYITKDEQRRRFKELEKNKDTSWRVNEKDWEQNKNYDYYLKAYDEMCRESDWAIIDANDKKNATLKVYSVVIDKLNEAIEDLDIRKNETPIIIKDTEPKKNQERILDKIDLTKSITDKEYKEELQFYQNMLSSLGHRMYLKSRSAVIVFEGTDASGKGGSIKRLIEKLDPRSYKVVSVSAPSKEELLQHYLYRFYNKMPKNGHITIFDRSWYGRVLVERIENFCTEAEWRRAYKEINDMEFHLNNHGTIIIKLLAQISKEEQLLRFNERQVNVLKQHKITDEDWRNREKWDQYQEAFEDMLRNTNTDYARWNIIESNQKKFARVKVLRYVVSILEENL